MKKLKTDFNKNDMKYIQVKWTAAVAMYQLSSLESDAPAGYEVWDIPIQNASKVTYSDGRLVNFVERERPPKNSEFGISYRSKTFIRRDLADKYYNLLISTKPNSPEFKLRLREMGMV
jgi:hypothetical protein